MVTLVVNDVEGNIVDKYTREALAGAMSAEWEGPIGGAVPHLARSFSIMYAIMYAAENGCDLPGTIHIDIPMDASSINISVKNG